MNKRKSKKLLALTAAAMGLPGYAPPARAWSQPETETGYRYTQYSESDLAAGTTNQRDRSRYAVQSHQFFLRMPQGEERELGADISVETMSGASPWFIVPAADGRPLQVMSGATIWDTRLSMAATLTDYKELGSRTYTAGLSKEKDYLSLGAGYEQAWELEDRHTSFNAGAQYSHDFLKPTDGASDRFPDRIKFADKGIATLYGGVSRVLGEDTTAQLNLSYIYSSGYLSDPYKKSLVGNRILPEQRPRHRNQFSLGARLRHYWSGLRAALHLDGSVSRDDWGVAAETLEAAWHQNLVFDLRLVPSLRWYQQAEADFHRPYFTSAPGDGLYSSDYRLSTFGALSYRLGLQREGLQWSFALGAERYESGSSYSLREADVANPGLVAFTVYTAAFSYKF